MGIKQREDEGKMSKNKGVENKKKFLRKKIKRLI